MSETLYNVKDHILKYGLILGEYSPDKNASIMYDTRQALLSGDILYQVGQLMWNKIKKYNPEVIYGTGIGAMNVLLATKIAAEIDGHKLNILFVRDRRKETNRLNIIEGSIPKKKVNAVVIEDLINSGETIRKCQRILDSEGVELNTVAIATIVDFWRFRGSRRFELMGIPVERLFFRHDLGDTRKDPKKTAIKNLKWRNLDNNQWSFGFNTQPLIENDKVYFANDKHKIYCHDVESGEIIWTFQGQKYDQPKGLCPTIETTNQFLFVSSYDGCLYKLNKLTGELIWKKHLDYYIHSSPCIDEINQQVYVGTEGGINNRRGDIVCLDLNTSQVKWRYQTKHVVAASPSLINNMVVCGSNDENLYAINNLTGELIWCVNDVGEIKGRVVSIDNIIIACNQSGVSYGIDFSGKILWKTSIGNSSIHQFLQTNGKLVYFITESFVVALDKSGNKIWIRRLRDTGVWNIKLFDDELMVTTKNGHVNILNAITGEKKTHDKFKCNFVCPGDLNQKYIALHSEKDGLFLYGRDND